jgi:hypothetical protein
VGDRSGGHHLSLRQEEAQPQGLRGRAGAVPYKTFFFFGKMLHLGRLQPYSQTLSRLAKATGAQTP